LGRGVRAQRGDYRLQNVIRASQRFVVPEAQDAESSALQPTRSLGIGDGEREIGVLSSIEFHDQPMLEANEIDDVDLDRLLALELVAKQASCTQSAPQHCLGIGCAATH
jgi:hypothetical protein